MKLTSDQYERWLKEAWKPLDETSIEFRDLERQLRGPQERRTPAEIAGSLPIREDEAVGEKKADTLAYGEQHTKEQQRLKRPAAEEAQRELHTTKRARATAVLFDDPMDGVEAT